MQHTLITTKADRLMRGAFVHFHIVNTMYLFERGLNTLLDLEYWTVLDFMTILK